MVRQNKFRRNGWPGRELGWGLGQQAKGTSGRSARRVSRTSGRNAGHASPWRVKTKRPQHGLFHAWNLDLDVEKRAVLVARQNLGERREIGELRRTCQGYVQPVNFWVVTDERATVRRPAHVEFKAIAAVCEREVKASVFSGIDRVARAPRWPSRSGPDIVRIVADVGPAACGNACGSRAEMSKGVQSPRAANYGA